MFEVYVLVSRKKSIMKQFFACLALFLAIVSLLMACIGPIWLPFSILAFIAWYFLQFRFNKEFEYAYFDGDVRFAKITDKSRRKRLKTFSMEEVVTIAPAGDRSVYNYENDSTTKTIDYTSGEKNVPYYVMVRKNAEATEVIKFEPDDKYLDAVCVKYPQKVVRRANLQ